MGKTIQNIHCCIEDDFIISIKDKEKMYCICDLYNQYNSLYGRVLFDWNSDGLIDNIKVFDTEKDILSNEEIHELLSDSLKDFHFIFERNMYLESRGLDLSDYEPPFLDEVLEDIQPIEGSNCNVERKAHEER